METTMPTTYAEAHATSGGAYRLARMWVDAPVRDGSAERELGELAVMSALTDWLKRWLPGHIQAAAIRHATLEEIAAATGMDTVLVRATWQEWANGQRHLNDKLQSDPDAAGIGLSVEDYNSAAAVLGYPEWPTN